VAVERVATQSLGVQHKLAAFGRGRGVAIDTPAFVFCLGRLA
jgi:hypothetical protein